MDDMYFSDKSRKRNNGGSNRPGEFTYDDFQDEYSDSPSSGKNKRFVVNIPESESTAFDRRPKGRPVSSNQPQTRQYSDIPPQYVPSSIDNDLYSERPTSTRTTSNYRKTSANTQRTVKRPNRNYKGTRRGKKKGVKLKVITAIICVVVICFLTIFGYGWTMLGKITYDKDFKDNNQYIKESKLATSSSVKNILFLGSDARGEIQGQRSDTMILFSIDKKHHKIKMTSFLRDSYVYIPSVGYKTRLNHAFSYGGPQLLIDTMEYNFGVKIDDYVLIDFEGFKKLIDLMGGLTVKDVTEAEAKYMRDVVKVIYIKEGTNHMSGAAALWYCRIRYLDNDFKRTERQRKVISAIIDQMLHTSPSKLIKIVEQVLPMITTSMDKSDLIPTIMSAMLNFIGSANPQHQIPAEGTWSNQRVSGMDVLVMDLDENGRLLEKFLYTNNKNEK